MNNPLFFNCCKRPVVHRRYRVTYNAILSWNLLHVYQLSFLRLVSNAKLFGWIGSLFSRWYSYKKMEIFIACFSSNRLLVQQAILKSFVENLPSSTFLTVLLTD